METLLTEQTTVADKIVVPSRCPLLSQPAGGQYLPAVRSLSGDDAHAIQPDSGE
jgi:hypothetical protein